MYFLIFLIRAIKGNDGLSFFGSRYSEVLNLENELRACEEANWQTWSIHPAVVFSRPLSRQAWFAKSVPGACCEFLVGAAKLQIIDILSTQNHNASQRLPWCALWAVFGCTLAIWPWANGLWCFTWLGKNKWNQHEKKQFFLQNTLCCLIFMQSVWLALVLWLLLSLNKHIYMKYWMEITPYPAVKVETELLSFAINFQRLLLKRCC